MPYSLLAIAVGAVLGAWLRWGIGQWLNPLFVSLPLGTLTANLLGAFIIGLATAWLANSTLGPNIKLLLVTGFCGALTTFSTFSLEMLDLLQRARLMAALTGIAVHVGGSLICAALGLACYDWWANR